MAERRQASRRKLDHAKSNQLLSARKRSFTKFIHNFWAPSLQTDKQTRAMAEMYLLSVANSTADFDFLFEFNRNHSSIALTVTFGDIRVWRTDRTAHAACAGLFGAAFAKCLWPLVKSHAAFCDRWSCSVSVVCLSRGRLLTRWCHNAAVTRLLSAVGTCYCENLRVCQRP